uniref:Chitinase n=1 Tax=Rhipicephalus appendiculatus TaxID=34631 RepID=A0A131YV15_RHIAP
MMDDVNFRRRGRARKEQGEEQVILVGDMQNPQGVYNNPAFYAPGDPSYAPTPGSEQPSPAFLPSPGFVSTPSFVEIEPERKESKSRGSGLGMTTVLLSMAVIILVATAIGVVIILATRSGTPHSDSGDTLGPILHGGLDKEVKPASDQPTPKTDPRPPPTLPTRQPYVSPPATREVIDATPLLCTMGEEASTVNAFPYDGLCDYIFFDSLYKKGRNWLTRRDTYGSSLNTFIDQHPDYKSTSLGVGFAYGYLSTALDDLSRAKRQNPLEPLWKKDICHVGILDISAMVTQNDTRNTVAALKAIDSALEVPRQQGRTCISVLSVPESPIDYSLEFALHFSHLSFTPYMILMFSHYRYGDNTLENCAIMPPTRHPMDLPPELIARSYNFDVSTATFSLIEYARKTVHFRGLISVTMKGRWTVPKSRDKVEFFDACMSDPNSNSFGRYTEVCPATTMKQGQQNAFQLSYSTTHCAMLAYSPTMNRAFAYDNEFGLAIKLCAAKADNVNLTFGIAAFDIDYDDYDNTCVSLNTYGRHSRLQRLKMVVDYFRSNTGVAYREDACRMFGA